MYNEENELLHYGVKGMKWGVRRYWNSDASLTSVGKRKRESTYNKAVSEYKKNKKVSKKYFAHPEDRKKNEKSYNKSETRLKKKVSDYLSTFNDKELKDIIKLDEEHGRRYVDGKMFDKTITYDDFIYLD